MCSNLIQGYFFYFFSLENQYPLTKSATGANFSYEIFREKLFSIQFQGKYPQKNVRKSANFHHSQVNGGRKKSNVRIIFIHEYVPM
jgi:hypothetical protein